MRRTLILCDGCEGAYHVLCVGMCRELLISLSSLGNVHVYLGLIEIPDSDWYCQWCVGESTTISKDDDCVRSVEETSLSTNIVDETLECSHDI
jgi:hypothetical protein